MSGQFKPQAPLVGGPAVLNHANRDWRHRLAIIVETMREMSMQTEPQAMVRAYIKRMRQLRPPDRTVSLSRRDLDTPHYRITRSSLWSEDINPWKDKSRLPVLQGGLLGELIYGNQPRLIDDLQFDAADPAAKYLQGQGCLLAIPQYDRGEALNMVVLMREQPGAFDPEEVPEMVWMSNLFGRATHSLVLSEELQRAYAMVDHELKQVADIQRSLLPARLPDIPTLNLAAHYQTSQRAGGDYYDFFALPGGQWGILLADVSGHGTPAAVVMAILHSIAHTYPGPPCPPGRLLQYLNDVLCRHYTGTNGCFVTAFYGIYDPAHRTLSYSCAGHNPPRVKHCSRGHLSSLNRAQTFPLGVVPRLEDVEHSYRFDPGDQMIFYTDGITEAMDAAGQMFGQNRLDEALENCHLDADGLINTVLQSVERFTGDAPAADDRTLLVAKVY